ncbi:agmatine deiminase family protein [Pelotomaculum propionicicum]|uniref:Putative agmatine deiminase n=1 Tax=Pelotomaculum propionicicum TaxID=258475 RepID=A0A4Y7RPR9_9FIRM|nr:agmatine deiminase family protein [Pelotomaculum propionicicum]TEB10995.1 putative agmatine deiminase [Pelotomaculum propionicicum]
MKKPYTIIILVLICTLAASCVKPFNNRAYKKPDYSGGSDPPPYVFPGEFENQQAVWLQWPEGFYSTASLPVYPVFIDIINALDPYVQVNLISQSNEESAQIEELLKANGYSGSNVHYYPINHQSIWARDVGPVFVKDSQGRLSVVDFGFNNYGRGASQDFIDVESQEFRCRLHFTENLTKRAKYPCAAI